MIFASNNKHPHMEHPVINLIYDKIVVISFVIGGVIGFTVTEVLLKVVLALLTGAAATIGAHYTKKFLNRKNKTNE